MTEWIACSERLPEINQVVALLNTEVWMNTGSDDFHCNWYGAGYLGEWGRKYWNVIGESRAQCLDAVTHWQPLPAPPAE
ncbi:MULTISPECIES: DUF551 domain-containing protein [Pseudomonas]|uniref:DUF551 domain-containing protein n=1 Tax=Pseudomonas TaxID=286 RepID=UPI000F4941EE|nr:MULTISPECIES: DUF551 domain-containing protein [Pseudomonas]MBY8958342.1 DUF551 domain-containing protein [Pseudomonas sp. MIS38]